MNDVSPAAPKAAGEHEPPSHNRGSLLQVAGKIDREYMDQMPYERYPELDVQRWRSDAIKADYEVIETLEQVLEEVPKWRSK